MNFPEVPFDENLFASNTMLKSYWERSTNERASATIPDWPSEESESNELKLASMDHWKNHEPVDSEGKETVVANKIVQKERPIGPLGAIVEPKMETSNILIIVFAGAAVVLIMLYFFYRMGQSSKRQ